MQWQRVVPAAEAEGVVLAEWAKEHDRLAGFVPPWWTMMLFVDASSIGARLTSTA